LNPECYVKESTCLNIFLTGATGFLGGHILKALLQEGHHIICAVRSQENIKTLQEISPHLTFAQIREEEELIRSLERCTVVVHLAGQLGRYAVSYDSFFSTNCELTEKLLLLSEKCGIRHFIFCSTPGVYGFGKRLCGEETPYAPRNDYEKTKVIAEQKIIGHCHNASIQYTILRPDFVYGPGDMRRIKMYRAIKNKKFVLTTNGKSYLHPTYIEDVKQAFLLCLENPDALNQIFNIAAANDMTAKEYLSVIAKYTNSKLIHINIGYIFSVIGASLIDQITQNCFNHEGFVSKNKIDFLSVDHSSNIEKAKKMLDYRPQYDFERGICETIRWCQKNNLL
jgi:UDP-glucose 4-epimerase